MSQNNYYEVVDADTIRQVQLIRTFDKTQLQTEIADVQAVLDLDDEAKQVIVNNSNFQTIEQLDKHLGTYQGSLRDVLEYWDYATRNVSLDLAWGLWKSPSAVHSVCGESGANVAANAIDGNIATYWLHNANERHWIILDLGFDKAVARIRIRLEAGDPAQAKLIEVNVHVGESLDQMFPVGTDLSFTVEDSWNNTPLTLAVGRYVKLDNMHTEAANNTIAIREIQVYCKTRAHTESSE